jgi:uncharacterized protein (TIGR03435 family)
MSKPLTSPFLVAIFAFAATAQPNEVLPSFEVADIHLSKPGSSQSGGIHPGGQIYFRSYSLKQLITFAWGLEPDMVSGPAWISSEAFDVVAKAPSAAPLATVRLMAKSLLDERFHLSMHLEDKEVPVYALVLGKHALKLKQGDPSANAECKFKLVDGNRTYVCQNMTMQGLADRLRDVAPAYLDRPVVDLTNLSDGYDFSLSWVGRSQTMPPVQAGENKVDASMSDGPTIFEAVSKQLGIELASRKRAMPSVVVDQVSKLPTEN